MNRIWLAALGGGALIAMLAGLKSESRAEPAAGDEALVLAADTMLGNAMRAGDKSIARKILSLQFSYVDDNGKLHERKEFLGDLKSLAALPATGAKATVYGQIAMVAGHRKPVPAAGQTPAPTNQQESGPAPDDTVFFLDIWAKQKGSWRALTMQDVVLAKAEPAKPAAAPDPDLKSGDCKNPCQTIPYRVRSPAEQDVVNAFQAIEKATFVRDADEWSKHIADEFVHYRSGFPPIPKTDRIAALREQKRRNAPAYVSAIQSMRLSVYGDGAAMTSTNGLPDDPGPPILRIARVWAKRNGQWQMVISVQTVIKQAQ